MARTEKLSKPSFSFLVVSAAPPGWPSAKPPGMARAAPAAVTDFRKLLRVVPAALFKFISGIKLGCIVDLLGQTDSTDEQMFSTASFSGPVEFGAAFAARPQISHVIFDWDGTLSWLRHGWPELMAGLFLPHLPEVPGESAEARHDLL